MTGHRGKNKREDKNPEEKGYKGLGNSFSTVAGEEVKFEARRKNMRFQASNSWTV